MGSKNQFSGLLSPLIVIDESVSDSDPELDLMSLRDNNNNYLKTLLNNFASQSLISSYE